MSSQYNIIILGGASRFTRPWAAELSKELDRHFQNMRIVEYEYWRDHTPEYFEPGSELNELTDKAENFGPYGIVAYSEGITVALRAVREGKIRPFFFIFIGFPYKWASARNLDDDLISWMNGLQVPTLYIQSVKDPNCEADYLRDMLERYVKNYQLNIIYNKYDSYYDNLYELSDKIRAFSDKIKIAEKK